MSKASPSDFYEFTRNWFVSDCAVSKSVCPLMYDESRLCSASTWHRPSPAYTSSAVALLFPPEICPLLFRSESSVASDSVSLTSVCSENLSRRCWTDSFSRSDRRTPPRTSSISSVDRLFYFCVFSCRSSRRSLLFSSLPVSSRRSSPRHCGNWSPLLFSQRLPTPSDVRPPWNS